MSYLTKSLRRTTALAAVLLVSAAMPLAATAVGTSVVDGLDYGPLAGLIGTWKSAPMGGVDVAPGRAGSKVGEDNPAVHPSSRRLDSLPPAMLLMRASSIWRRCITTSRYSARAITSSFTTRPGI